MFEGLADIAAAWRTILHVSEWSGLSIGALAAGAGLIYLVPASRKLVILGAVGGVLLWLGLIHGDRTGRADVEAQWADARKAAIAAEHDRDELVELQLQAKYQPTLARLTSLADERKRRSDDYEKRIIGLLAKAPAGKPRNACELGAAADRVPKRK